MAQPNRSSGARPEHRDRPESLTIQELLDLAAPGRGSGVVGQPSLGREMMLITSIQRGEPLPGILWCLQNRSHPEHQVPMEGSGRTTGGYFMEHQRGDFLMFPASRVSQLAASGLVRDVQLDRLHEWEIHAAWMEPAGAVDLPVTLDDLIIPRQKNDTRKPEDILAALHVTAQTPAREVKSRVRLALAIPQLTEREEKDDAVTVALSRLLATVSREHLPVLLELAKEELPPGNMQMRYRFDEPLCQRIAELRRSEPRLLHYLRFALVDRKLFPYGEAHGPDWKDMTDEALHKNWQASYTGEVIYDDAIKHAAPRGLAWVPAAVAEVTELLPSTDEVKEVVKFMSKISDCPDDPKAAIPWLQQNAARLKWDAAAKRWVLPPP